MKHLTPLYKQAQDIIIPLTPSFSLRVAAPVQLTSVCNPSSEMPVPGSFCNSDLCRSQECITHAHFPAAFVERRVCTVGFHSEGMTLQPPHGGGARALSGGRCSPLNRRGGGADRKEHALWEFERRKPLLKRRGCASAVSTEEAWVAKDSRKAFRRPERAAEPRVASGTARLARGRRSRRTRKAHGVWGRLGSRERFPWGQSRDGGSCSFSIPPLRSAWAENLTTYSAEHGVHLCKAEGSASRRPPPAHPLLRPRKSQAAALISLQVRLQFRP